MKSWRLVRSVPVCAVLIVCYLIKPASGQTQKPPLYAEDHILVKLRPQTQSTLKAVTRDEYLSGLASGLGLAPGMRLEEPAVSRLLVQPRSSSATSAPATPVDLSRFLYLYLPAGMSVPQAVQSLAGHPWVEYAEPDGVGTAGLVPNDPLFPQQWHHNNPVKAGADIHSPSAWDVSQGASSTLVAILDTGLADPLPEFAGRIVPGYNFVSGNTDTTDDEGHGTAIAGVLGANANNSLLGVGVNWHCQLMPIKVVNETNFGLYSWWAQGVDYAVGRGAKVINLSAGGFTNDTTLTLSISNAIAHGVLFVTITHNDGANAIRFPGNLPMCITVGGTDENDQRLPFSNYGPEIDLVAPGTNIYTGGWTGDAEVWWGTSMSGAQVSGVCSLLAGLWPAITQDQARALLCAGAEDGVGDASDTPGFDIYYGWGRLNAYNSLLLAQTRIDRVLSAPRGGLVLSWPSPANASQRQPYRIASSSSVAGPWTHLNSTTNFGYTQTRTYWTNNAPSVSATFYRVQIFQP